jgi:hypothetical protein
MEVRAGIFCVVYFPIELVENFYEVTAVPDLHSSGDQWAWRIPALSLPQDT